MGQQQLLLLVLATVIVGLATVAGIQAFEQGSNQAEQDALTQQAVKIASDIQARVKEPSQFGGYDGDYSSAQNSITLEEMGYSTGGEDSNVYSSANGDCAILGNDLGVDSDIDSGSGIQVICESPNNEVVAYIVTDKSSDSYGTIQTNQALDTSSDLSSS
jgi:hypothetical protein